MTRHQHDTDKADLRSRLRAARAALDPVDRQDQSRALAQAVLTYLRDRGPDAAADGGRGRTIAAYLGVDPEPHTAPLLSALDALGLDVVVPVCEPSYQLSWAAWSPGVALRRSVRAPVREPEGPRRTFRDLPGVALVVVPALGVDRAGQRIGQGGGYYDRFLAQHPSGPEAVPRLGMVFRSEVLPAGTIPAEPHDQPLDGVFTPDGVLCFNTAARPV